MVMHNAFYKPMNELDILIIEDNLSMTKIYKNILTSFGVKKINSVISVDEAKKTLRRVQPDFIICDFMLNDTNFTKNGLSFLKWIRQADLAPLCFTPVLMATGHASRLRVLEFNKYGASGVLVKPISPTILKQRIDKILTDNRNYLVEAGRVFIEGAIEYTQPKTKDNLVYDPGFLSRRIRNDVVTEIMQPKVKFEILEDNIEQYEDDFELEFKSHLLID